jgi:hypothetical protein
MLRMTNGDSPTTTTAKPGKPSLILELAVVTALVLGGVWAVCFFKDSFKPLEKWGWMAVFFIFVLGGWIPAFIRREPLEKFGWTLAGLRRSLFSVLLAGAVVFPIFYGGAYLIIKYNVMGAAGHVSAQPLESQTIISAILFQFLYVAIGEEAFFRGYFQTRVSELVDGRMLIKRIRFSIAGLNSALMFALGHYLIRPEPASLLTFFPGLAFGILREYTSGLIAPVLFHGFCNVSMMIFMNLMI